MNSTHNKKLYQVTKDMLFIRIGIGENIHSARACDWSGFEFPKRAFMFKNSRDGVETFLT